MASLTEPDTSESFVFTWPSYLLLDEEGTPIFLQEPRTGELFLGLFTDTDNLRRFCADLGLAPYCAAAAGPMELRVLLKKVLAWPACPEVGRLLIDCRPPSAGPSVWSCLDIQEFIADTEDSVRRDPLRN